MRKIMFMALSFMLAVGLFAFTVSYSKSAGSPDPQYFWYAVTYDVNGNPMIENQLPIDHITYEEAEEDLYDCGGDDRVCKAGFLIALDFEETDPITEGTDGDANFKAPYPNP